MNVWLGPKFASELTIFVYFSISSLLYVLVQRPSSWCWRPVCITVSHHLTMVTVGQGMYALPVDYSEKLSDSIANSDVNSGCYMLFLFLFALLLYMLNIFQFQSYDAVEHCSTLAIKRLRLHHCLWCEFGKVFV